MKKASVIFVMMSQLTICFGDGLRADFTNDGIVDFEDFSVFAMQWLAQVEEANVIPKFEYNADSDRLSVSRESIGYNIKLDEFAANTPRTENVCVASIGELEIFPQAGYVVKEVTPNAVYVVHGNGAKLSTTTDAVNYSEIVDISSLGLHEEAIVGVKLLVDGSLLLFTSHWSYDGHILRRADAGSDWVIVAEMRGYIQYWGLTGFKDNGECVVGTYGEYSGYPGQENPRKIWYSADYGKTWAAIYTHEDLGHLHCHLATFSPLDTSTVYASYGDNVPNCKVIKLVYTGGDKSDPANWKEAENSPLLQRLYNSVCALPDGNYIYWGRDSGHYPIILKHDVRTDTFTEVLDSPHYNYNADVPYYTGGYGLKCFSIIEHDGVYYAAVRDTGGILFNPNNGIYASADGDNWVCVYRKEMKEMGCDHWCGFFTVVGYCNGYLWGVYSAKNNISDSWHVYRMKPVNAVTKRVCFLERGAVNILTEDASCFENTDGGWAATGDVDVTETGRTTEEALIGSACLKVVPEDHGVGYLTLKGPCWNPKPATGDYLVASAYIKGGPNFPEDYGGEGIQTSRFRIVVEGAGNGAISSQISSFYVSKNMVGWQRIVLWGRCTNDDFSVSLGPRIIFDLGRGDYAGDAFADAIYYIDGVQVVYFDDLHYSGSWTRGGTTRADEFGVVPLTGIGATYSVSFTWLPICASREWHNNMNIACIAQADGNYINLLYDKTVSTFKIDDGTHSALTSRTYTWEHFDIINFCIVNDGSSITLYIKTSLDGGEENMSDSEVALGALPVFMLLNTDYYNSAFGCGKFANIRAWDSKLSAADVNDVFSTVTDMIQP